jgi:hypothetical protein
MNPYSLRSLAFFTAASLPLPLAGQDLLGVDFNGFIWRMNSTTGAVTNLGFGSLPAHNGLALVGNTYWAAAVSTTHGLSVIDPVQGRSTLVLAPTSEFRCLAGFGASLLGVRTALTSPVGELVSIDTTTGGETVIGSTGLTTLTALTMHSGTLYGWDNNLGLVTLDLATGNATDVNPLVGNPACCGSPPIQYLTSHPDGRLLAGRTILYNVDPGTGVAVAIGNSSPADLRGVEPLVPGFNLPTPNLCAGVNGPVGISALSSFRLLSTGSGRHTPGAVGNLIIGASRTTYLGSPLPISLGFLGNNCLLNVSPDVLVFGRADFTGALSFSLPLPPLPSPVTVFVQHVALEPAVGSIVTTISLAVTLNP